MKQLKFPIVFGVVLLLTLFAVNSKAQEVHKSQLSSVLEDSTSTLKLTVEQHSKLLSVESEYFTDKTAIENGESLKTRAIIDSIEVTQWLSVLKPKQIVELKKALNKANKARALVLARKAWLKAEKDSIAVDYGKDTSIQQMTNYLANRFTVHTLLYENKQLCDSADKVVAATCPRILTEVNDYEGNWADKSGIINVVWKNRAELRLTRQQKALVISKGKEEARQVILAYERPDSFSFNRANYEADVLPNILSNYQYSTVLRIKHLSAAQKKANVAWNELTNKGLITGLNKDTTLNQATEYYLATLTTSSRLSNQPELLKNSLKDLANNLPEALLLLKHASDAAKGKPSSGTYSW